MLKKILFLFAIAVPGVSFGSPISDHYDQRTFAINTRINSAQWNLIYAANIRSAANFIAFVSSLPACMAIDPNPTRQIEGCVGPIAESIEQTKLIEDMLSKAPQWVGDPHIRQSAENLLADAKTLEANLLELRSVVRPIVGADSMYPDAPVIGFEKLETRRAFCTKKVTEVQLAQKQYRTEFDAHVRVGDVHLMRSDFANTKALWDGTRFLATRCLVTNDEASKGITVPDLSATLYQTQVDSLKQTLQYMWDQSQTIPEDELIARACTNLRSESKVLLTEVCRSQKLNLHSEYTLHLGLTTDLAHAVGGK